MNNTFLNIFTAFILTALAFDGAYARQDSEPVKQLKALYNTDKEFRATLNLAFENLHKQPDGSANPWQGKSVDDLYAYFNDWFYFLPDTSNGLEYIAGFTWLYYKNPYGLKVVNEEPGLSWTRHFVVERGKYMDSEASAQGVKRWLRDPSVPMEDFIVPPGGFQSFNAFFTREIKPGARPIAAVSDDAVVAAPADCVMNMINSSLTVDSKIPLKGRMQLNVRELLHHSPLASRFIGGTAVACFLLPTTYHHYHAPVSGVVLESKENVYRRYFGLNNFPAMINNGNVGYNADFSVFERFIHGYFVIKTQRFGHVAMVPVGLNTVGSVIFEEKYKNVDAKTPVPVSKGEKLGHFAYGGSLVMLLFEKDRLSSLKIPQGQQVGIMH